VKITPEGEGPDRTWKVAFNMSVNLDQLDAIAEGIEAGEIDQGAFVLTLEPEVYDQIDPELVRRLAGFIERKA